MQKAERDCIVDTTLWCIVTDLCTLPFLGEVEEFDFIKAFFFFAVVLMPNLKRGLERLKFMLPFSDSKNPESGFPM